jgi:hypothetical protein
VEAIDLFSKKHRRMELNYKHKVRVNYIQLVLPFYTCLILRTKLNHLFYIKFSIISCCDRHFLSLGWMDEFNECTGVKHNYILIYQKLFFSFTTLSFDGYKIVSIIMCYFNILAYLQNIYATVLF